ncbi:hypothetical protein V6N13_036439 [Hibiscus sabdariffa]
MNSKTLPFFSSHTFTGRTFTGSALGCGSGECNVSDAHDWGAQVVEDCESSAGEGPTDEDVVEEGGDGFEVYGLAFII